MQGVRQPGDGYALELRWGTRINYDVGYSGPMRDNGLVRGHAGATTVKVLSVPGQGFRGKNPVRREEKYCGCKEGVACRSCRDCTTPCPACLPWK